MEDKYRRVNAVFYARISSQLIIIALLFYSTVYAVEGIE